MFQFLKHSLCNRGPSQPAKGAAAPSLQASNAAAALRFAGCYLEVSSSATQATGDLGVVVDLVLVGKAADLRPVGDFQVVAGPQTSMFWSDGIQRFQCGSQRKAPRTERMITT